MTMLGGKTRFTAWGGGTASLWLLRLQSFIVAKRFVR